MIGIDIVKISRFEKRVQNEKFIGRILGNEEKNIFKTLNNEQKILFLAKIFCVKEACYKASGSKKNFNDYNLIKINNVPVIKEEVNWKISISHEKKYLVAVCMIKN